LSKLVQTSLRRAKQQGNLKFPDEGGYSAKTVPAATALHEEPRSGTPPIKMGGGGLFPLAENRAQFNSWQIKQNAN